MNFKVGDKVIVTNADKTLLSPGYVANKVLVITKFGPAGDGYPDNVPEDETVAWCNEGWFLRLDCIRHLTKLEKALQ